MNRATKRRAKAQPSQPAAPVPSSWLHEPFLERAADPGLTDGGQAALGAFLTLRLIDRFAVGPDRSQEQALAYQTQATRDYLLDLSSATPEPGYLMEIVRVADAVRTGSHRRILWPPLQAYAYWLEQELRLAEALDVVEAAHRLTNSEAVGEQTAAHLQRGRILRLLGRFDEARQAYEKARARAIDSGDMHSALLSRIGEAIVLRHVGNLPASETALRDIVKDAEELGDRDAQARAQHDLGTVLFHRERAGEALTHLFRAFELYEQPEYQLRALCDVGEALKRQGHYSAAKDAFTVVLKRGGSLQTRATTLILALELAALSGDRVGFARWAREIDLIDDTFPPERAVDAELQLGRGQALFGQFEKAGASLRRALELAKRYQLHEYAFRAQEELAGLESNPARAGIEERDPAQADQSKEVVEIAEKLFALRAS